MRNKYDWSSHIYIVAMLGGYLRGLPAKPHLEQPFPTISYFLENEVSTYCIEAEEGVGLARLRVWHGTINNENTSGYQEEPNVELDDDVDIADDMILANGIERAVEYAGADVVELDDD